MAFAAASHTVKVLRTDGTAARRSRVSALVLLAPGAILMTMMISNGFQNTTSSQLNTAGSEAHLAPSSIDAPAFASLAGHVSAPVARGLRVSRHALRASYPKFDYNGTTKKFYIQNLKHQKWVAESQYPRVFGYVEKWNDTSGEGIIRDQENTQKYLVIRDEIGRCYHNHKTLQRMEFVEFFATQEIDAVAQLPLALNVSGPLGSYVKGSEEYRNLMLAHPNFPKRWGDNYEEYTRKTEGEWYLRAPWKNDR